MKPLKLYLDHLPAVKKLAPGYQRNLQQAKEDRLSKIKKHRVPGSIIS